MFFRQIGTANKLEKSTPDNTGELNNSEHLKENIPEDFTFEDDSVFEYGNDSIQEFEDEFEENEDEEVLVESEINESNGIDLNKKYLIVVGSFGNLKYAKAMQSKITASGKDCEVEMIRGMHRVITASTDDQNDAQNLRDHFTHIYKQTAFILSR